MAFTFSRASSCTQKWRVNLLLEEKKKHLLPSLIFGVNMKLIDPGAFLQRSLQTAHFTTQSLLYKKSLTPTDIWELFPDTIAKSTNLSIS